ncbi:MAG: DRTGG domain-containing protein [Peptococcales bacterium]|jgi:BioD-like phosphotransacetylase family protein
MKLTEIVKELDLTILVEANLEEKNVQGVYICDLLSNVMAHGHEGNLWITVQTHQNILAVASLLNFSAIILPEGLTPEQAVLEKASEGQIPILQSAQGVFELAGKLYEMGLRGN